MEGDFFLFKFSCAEDFDPLWNNVMYFLNDKLFIFKKWSRYMKPMKENFKEISLSIKFPNLCLCYWHENGFSKITRKVRIPLAIYVVTMSKSFITFSRVCVQISPSFTLLEEITLNLNGSPYKQQVSYDWKPKACLTCHTFSHDISSYPLNPYKHIFIRGHNKR